MSSPAYSSEPSAAAVGGGADSDILSALDLLLANAPAGFALLDRSLRILRVNRALAALSGKEPDAFIGRTLAEAIPDLAPTLEPIFRRVLETGESVMNVEVSRSGRTPRRFFRASYFPVKRGAEIIGAGATVIDITDLKNTEQELLATRAEAERTQERLRGALKRLNFHLENSPVVVTEWDKNFILKYWSPQAEVVFGWKAEEVVGRTPFDFGFIHAEDEHSVKAINDRLVHAGEPRNISCNRNYDKHGNLHFCEWYNSALMDENGQLASIFSITMDVTDRARAEEELGAREESMRLAYQAGHLWFWEVDAARGEIHYSDSTSAPYAPYVTSLVNIEDYFRSLHPEDSQRVRDAIRATLIDGRPYDIEYRQGWPDGTVHWVYSRGGVYPDPNRPNGRFLGVAMDVTARRRTEIELKESRERLRMAAEAARLCAWDWSVRTGEVRWSGDFQAVYGCDPETVRHIDEFFAMVLADDRERVQEEFKRVIATARPNFRTEFRVSWPDGTIHWVLAFGRVVLDAEGRPTRMVGVNMDLTERKRSEEALRLNDRLIATGRMAAALAHEINNPLASVTNLLYLLEAGSLDQAAREYVNMAAAEISRVANITRNILGLYRESPTAIQLDINDLIDNVLALYQSAFEKKRVRLVRNYRSTGEVRGFPGEMRQLFSNLIGNALDAMQRAGTVTIRVRPLFGSVLITVADTGPGISPEHVNRIWEPFFTTKGEKGTGLGLWISRQIVAKHGGTIRVHSRTTAGASGTAFCVLLPAAQRAAVTVAAG